MFMPKSHGYSKIVHARCSLSGYPEARPLRSENAKAIGDFLFEEILCRWGAVEEIITDNGAPYIKALEYMTEKWGIHHIRISGYNSRANGVIERPHRTFRETLMKICENEEAKWASSFRYALWAERVSIQKSTGYSPYWIVHGIEPLFPFDLAEATYMLPTQNGPISTIDLLALRARQLEK
jgi:hypothetical protein